MFWSRKGTLCGNGKVSKYPQIKWVEIIIPRFHTYRPWGLIHSRFQTLEVAGRCTGGKKIGEVSNYPLIEWVEIIPKSFQIYRTRGLIHSRFQTFEVAGLCTGDEKNRCFFKQKVLYDRYITNKKQPTKIKL